MNRVNWTVVVIVGVLAALALFVVGSLLGGPRYGGWGYGGWGMMGPGMMGGMFFMWLIPLGFLVLTVLGIAWFVRAIAGGGPALAQHACPNCSRSVQANWRNCPHCGTVLAK
jgi:uncharacterized membrane protein